MATNPITFFITVLDLGLATSCDVERALSRMRRRESLEEAASGSGFIILKGAQKP